jgi:hypothetical protein
MADNALITDFTTHRFCNCLKNKEKTGGDDGDRTRDLSVANAALSQLSYTPT